MKMHIKPKLFVAALALLLIYFGIGGDYNLYNLWTLNKKRRQLEKELHYNQRLQSEYAKEIELLKSDLNYIEQTAREQFNMGKPGETIYLFKAKPR